MNKPNINYITLSSAGLERYVFESRLKLPYPGDQTSISYFSFIFCCA